MKVQTKSKFRFYISLSFKIFLILGLILYLRNYAEADESSQIEQTPLGSPISGMSSQELALFNVGKAKFEAIDSVTGQEPGATDPGLGPQFNMNSCGGCHAYPVTGGTSPLINPQVHVATEFGARNKIPYFITINGPVREARFKFLPDGVRDGGVHDLYVITGRADAQGCNIAQPDFEAEKAKNNISFRIPTPLYGAGLIESISDETILNNMLTDGDSKRTLGIRGRENRTDTLLAMGGHLNRSGNDGTITRFGWKAQNKSLAIFAGEAYNVEQGVTNELFQDERDGNTQCHFNPTPEDYTNVYATTQYQMLSDVDQFSFYMRFLAPPKPKPFTAAAERGLKEFTSIGCNFCHTPSLSTGQVYSPALSNKKVNLYSDLLLHSMGPGLADNIIQQFAGPDDFRTAPLWGLSQRLFYLHDGRTNNLTTAILAHASTNPKCMSGQDTTSDGIHCNSEANAVIKKFQELTPNRRADLLEFLNSL